MEMEMELATDLVNALEKATIMAKQLSSTATESAKIYASLHAAHRQLSLFLSHAAKPSADVTDGDDAPMEVADEEQQTVSGAREEDSKMAMIDSVEERMKNCFVQKNKRPKRPLSPTWLAAGEQKRLLEYESESARVGIDYDPHITKLRALDLIYQFHC
ncbi:unnamed protein product [Lactuca virosa]|uniref:Uncharacterized protein n=1 Tax=Lactuca virosa TaxID=75947 RepID=A0AAU9PDT6_9ASTR|nr:unnamed protein product [Lactuca virosa]